MIDPFLFVAGAAAIVIAYIAVDIIRTLLANRALERQDGRIWVGGVLVLTLLLWGLDFARPRASEVTVANTGPLAFERLAIVAEVVRWQ